MIDKIATNETVVNVAIATTYPGATLMCSSIKAEIIDETKEVNSDKRRFLFMSYSFLTHWVVETGVSSQTHDQTTSVSASDIRALDYLTRSALALAAFLAALAALAAALASSKATR